MSACTSTDSDTHDATQPETLSHLGPFSGREPARISGLVRLAGGHAVPFAPIRGLPLSLTSVALPAGTLVGLGLALVSGICLGIFLAPMRLAQAWKWENAWALWSVVAMLAGPLAMALYSVPQPLAVYREIGAASLLLTLAIGAVAGTSGFLYALAVPAIGLGLGTALNTGAGIAVALVPLALVHGATAVQRSGLLTILGILVTILGISLCAKGGSLRERQLPRGRSKLPFATGVVLSVVAGVISSAMNVGLAFPNHMFEVAAKYGSSAFGAAVTFLAPYLVGGFVSNFLYAAYLLHRNRTVSRFWAPGSLRSVFCSLTMAVLFVAGIGSYAASVAMLGSFGAIVAWGIFTAATILSSGVWDVLRKEWNGRAARFMLLGVGVLLAAIVILGLAQHFHQLDKLDI